MNQLVPAEFHGTPLNIIDHAGKRWLTAEQVGLALGYNEANARQGIGHLFRRHADEFTEVDTCEVKMTSQGQMRELRLFSSGGCIKLGFFANTGRAKDFRAWAAKVLDGQPAPVAPAPRLRTPGRTRITRSIERQVFELFVAGWRQVDIAKQLGISAASVNLLLRAQYRFAPGAGQPEASYELLVEVAGALFEIEQQRLVEAQARIAQTFMPSAHNADLAEVLEALGQQLALPVLESPQGGGRWAPGGDASTLSHGGAA